MKYWCLISWGVLLFVLSLNANLVENGNFSNDLQGWDYTPAEGVSIVEGMAILENDGSFSEPTDLQLMNTSIDSIEYGNVYELSFDAFANATNTSISAVIKEEFGDLYYDSTFKNLEVTRSQQTYTSTFIVRDSAGISSPSVQFNCGLAEADIAIDNVSVIKSEESGIVVENPSAGEGYPSGDTVTVSWFATQDVEKIAIAYSLNGGGDWTSVVDSTLFDEVMWAVPQDTSDSVMIRVSDAQGDAFDETGLFSIGITEDTTGKYLIQNGDFSEGFDSWSGIQLDPDAVNSGEIVDGRLAVYIDSVTQSPEDCQLQQEIGGIDSGGVYRLSFNAFSSDKTVIYPRVCSMGREVLYLDGVDTAAYLTPKEQRYSYVFEMEESDEDPLVQFNLGSNEAEVYLDDISLSQVEDGALRVTNPVPGEVFHVTSSIDIQWASYDIDSLGSLQIEYSIDDGNEWRSIAEDVYSAFGEYVWDLPDVSSDQCRLRISALEGAYTAVTGRFEITPEYDSVDLEQIVNPSFSNGTQGWALEVLEDSAAAEASADGDQYFVSIDDGGNEPGYVQIVQTGIYLEAGESYKLSFDAVAAGGREILVNLTEDTAGYPSYVDVFPETLTVGTNVETYTYEFVTDSSASDNDARLSFSIGGASSDVIIDNVSLMLQAEEIEVDSGDVVGVETSSEQGSGNNIFSLTGAGRKLFSVSLSKPVSLRIYDVTGRMIRGIDIRDKNRVDWDMRSSVGDLIANGVYFISIIGKDKRLVKKLSINR